jgi:hypothetical protein
MTKYLSYQASVYVVCENGCLTSHSLTPDANVSAGKGSKIHDSVTTKPKFHVKCTNNNMGRDAPSALCIAAIFETEIYRKKVV